MSDSISCERQIEAWIQYHQRMSNGDSAANLFWAWEWLNEHVLTDPETAWPIIVDLVRRSPSDVVLMNIAAGPLEDLLSYHGDEVIDRVEHEATKSERFRACLKGVWVKGRVPKRLRQRLAVLTRPRR